MRAERPPAGGGGGLFETMGDFAVRRPILASMALTTAEARQEMLDTLGEAIESIAFALAALGAAYEQLDEHNADRLEEELFRPIQTAYGRAKRTHEQFATRHGLRTGTFESGSQSPGLPSTRAKGFIDSAVEAAGEADRTLATLQDSPMLVEVGDVQLRSGLAEVRELVGGLAPRARELVRTLGR
jgi:hypothetical protein